ncbi:MAG: CDP-alcohol phosphatidyltransferase family protein [Pseudomonadota bacterium]
MKAAHIPNIITILRILLVVPTGWLLWQQRYTDAFILMAIAGISDALDGALARRFNWMSKLGAALDPLADKLLVAVMFVVFTFQELIPLWVAIIVLIRDFVIVAGAGVYKLLYEEVEIAPTFVSKANTAMQIIALLLLMASLLNVEFLSSLAGRLVDPYCFYILAVLGVSSGIDYVVSWGSKAYRQGKQRKTYKHGPKSMRPKS